MTLKEFVLRCQTDARLRPVWERFAKVACDAIQDQIGLAFRKIGPHEIQADYRELNLAQHHLVTTCTDLGIQVPDLSLKSLVELFVR